MDGQRRLAESVDQQIQWRLERSTIQGHKYTQAKRSMNQTVWLSCSPMDRHFIIKASEPLKTVILWLFDWMLDWVVCWLTRLLTDWSVDWLVYWLVIENRPSGEVVSMVKPLIHAACIFDVPNFGPLGQTVQGLVASIQGNVKKTSLDHPTGLYLNGQLIETVQKLYIYKSFGQLVHINLVSFYLVHTNSWTVDDKINIY